MATKWSDELASLERVMQVYEELQGDNEPLIQDLITPARRLVRADDVTLKEAPFAQSKKMPHRLYVFKDVVILARPLDGAHRKAGEKLKVAHYLGLRQCTIRPCVKDDAEGHAGITLTHVTRLRVHPDGSLCEPNEPGGRIVTRIEKMEAWFAKPALREDVSKTINGLLEDLEDEEHKRRESALAAAPQTPAEGAAAAGDDVKKQRSWAKKRNTLTKPLPSHSTDETDSAADAVAGLSLSDLEARYSIDFKTAAPSSERAEFEVSFGEGPMGFSLGSGAGVGVIVGRLAPQSFADMGGVCIGDRILSINGEDIGLNVTWQECVAKLKELPRPVSVMFERSATRQVDPDNHHDDADDTASAAGGGADKSRSESSGSDVGSKKRSWAARRAHARSIGGGAGGLIHLHELEKMYNAASTVRQAGDQTPLQAFALLKPANPAEKASTEVLKEMFETERVYIDDLRALVGEYILPLRRTMRRGRCKEIEGGSKICEHNLIRSTCTRQCTDAQPILDGETMKVIFCNTETLLRVNTELFDVLQTGLLEVGKRKSATLADVAGVFAPAFQHITPFFKMYATYCNQYPHAIERLMMVRQTNPDLHTFLSEREKKSSATSLSSLLIKPVQRICKYPLLFAELLKQLKGVSSDAAMSGYIREIEKAADAVHSIANSVNKQVADSENMEMMLHVFEELGGEKGVPGLVAAHRHFIRSDDVRFVDPSDTSSKEVKDRLLYLFNDICIIAKLVNSGGTLHKQSSGSLSVTSASDRPKSLVASALTLVRKTSRSTPSLKVQAKVEHWLEIETTTVLPIDKPDAHSFYGMSIKHVGRITKDDKKVIKTQGSGRIVTTIDKFEVWFETKGMRDDVVAEFQKQIEIQENLEAGQRKAESEVGAVKQQRSWTKKSRADTPGGLHELAEKYNQKGVA